MNLYGFVGNDGVNAIDDLGLKTKETYELTLVGAGGVDPFGGFGTRFGSREHGKAMDSIVKYFDSDNDGKLTQKDCPPFRIRIIGYSWGGWSALILIRKLGDKVDNKKHLKVALGTLDPVSTLREPVLGDGGMPNYVVGAWNVYQRNGMRRALFNLAGSLFNGEPVTDAAGVGPGGVQNVSEFGLIDPVRRKFKKFDHISIQYFAQTIKSKVRGAKL
jgi:hypothetical protein